MSDLWCGFQKPRHKSLDIGIWRHIYFSEKKNAAWLIFHKNQNFDWVSGNHVTFWLELEHPESWLVSYILFVFRYFSLFWDHYTWAQGPWTKISGVWCALRMIALTGTASALCWRHGPMDFSQNAPTKESSLLFPVFSWCSKGFNFHHWLEPEPLKKLIWHTYHKYIKIKSPKGNL